MFLKNALIGAAALLLAPIAAQADRLHGFAKPAYHLPTGGRQVSQAELAGNPERYYTEAGYRATLRQLGVGDRQFRELVRNAKVIDCKGQRMDMLAIGDDSQTYLQPRDCVPGEKLLVQASTGRVLLSLGCLNLILDQSLPVNKPVRARFDQPDGGNTSPPTSDRPGEEEPESPTETGPIDKAGRIDQLCGCTAGSAWGENPTAENWERVQESLSDANRDAVNDAIAGGLHPDDDWSDVGRAPSDDDRDTQSPNAEFSVGKLGGGSANK